MNQAKLIRAARQLILGGTKYVYQGRDVDGMDCHGLFLYLYKEGLDIELPDLITEEQNETGSQGVVDRGLTLYEPFMDEIGRLEVGRSGDVVLMYRSKRQDNHLGICLGNGMMVQAQERTGITSIPLSRVINTKHVKFYRYKTGAGISQ